MQHDRFSLHHEFAQAESGEQSFLRSDYHGAFAEYYTDGYDADPDTVDLLVGDEGESHSPVSHFDVGQAVYNGVLNYKRLHYRNLVPCKHFPGSPAILAKPQQGHHTRIYQLVHTGTVHIFAKAELAGSHVRGLRS